MSAISTDRVPTKIATPATPERKRSREEVFHSALESYIASYRKRHSAPNEVAPRRNSAASPWFFPRIMNWSRS
jgi:hypothetical protein